MSINEIHIIKISRTWSFKICWRLCSATSCRVQAAVPALDVRQYPCLFSPREKIRFLLLIVCTSITQSGCNCTPWCSNKKTSAEASQSSKSSFCSYFKAIFLHVNSNIIQLHHHIDSESLETRLLAFSPWQQFLIFSRDDAKQGHSQVCMKSVAYHIFRKKQRKKRPGGSAGPIMFYWTG